MPVEVWRERVIELSAKGMRAEALQLVQEAVAKGSAAAKVRLASLWTEAGMTSEMTDALIAEAEQSVEDNDKTLHLELSRAYDLRLGAVPYEEKPRRSLMHLERAAELGSGASDCLAIARIYRCGSLNIEADLAKAEHWYRRAISEGSDEAVTELRAIS
jgi:TPR repeat protein